MLSFDVEEYFQVEAAAGSVERSQWDSFEDRLTPCVELILELLHRARASATFFVLGWIAQRRRRVVQAIADAGHEIASHGMTHEMLARLEPREFRRQLLDSRKLLEDIAQRPVVAFRAPTFSITQRTAWAIDVLAEEGFEYDSSIFPIRRGRYGIADAPRGPHIAIGPGGGRILEIPPLTMRVAGVNVPVGGGGYLRLLPVRLLALALAGASRAHRPAIVYMHPWEFDPAQPVLPMASMDRWRHRVNLKRTERKLQWLLERFNFTTIGQCAGALAEAAGETHHYGAGRE